MNFRYLLLSTFFFFNQLKGQSVYIPTGVSGIGQTVFGANGIGIGVNNPWGALEANDAINEFRDSPKDAHTYARMTLGQNKINYWTLEMRKADDYKNALSFSKIMLTGNNTDYGTPFILYPDGNVSIGSATPVSDARLKVYGDVKITDKLLIGDMTFPICTNNTLKLYVNGTIGATEVRVSTSKWCDYVFDSNYKLQTLKEVERYIRENKHLPGVPSENEVTENGLSMSEMFKIQMKKIEELMLYVIELKKENEQLAIEIDKLKK